MRLQQIDADIIVAHKLYDFLLDVLLHRMDALKVGSVWSKIGRLRRNKMPFVRGRLLRKYLGCGRLFVDTFISSQEFIHSKTYTLSHLVETQLDVKGHSNFNNKELSKEWINGKSLANVITHCCNDGHLCLRLMFKLQILALTKELTTLCGNQW